MNLRLIVISAACLSIFAVPASCISLLAAAAAVKGVIVGAGLTALKTLGGSETVIIESEPGSVAEVVPANQIIVQDNVHNLHAVQTISYASSSPLSRLWGAVANAISAKTEAISDLFRPNRVVIVPTTQKPLITIDLEHKPLPGIDIEVVNKPSILPGFGIEVGNIPWILPGIGIEVGNKPLTLPSIDIDVDSKPLGLPSIEVSASYGPTFRRHPVAVINYLKK